MNRQTEKYLNYISTLLGYISTMKIEFAINIHRYWRIMTQYTFTRELSILD